MFNLAWRLATLFRSFRIFSTTLLLLVASPVLVAQHQPPNPQPKPTVIGPPKTAPSPQQTFVSYWTLEPGWNTELEMRNNMAQGKLTITPVLRTATGQEIPLIPVSLSPEQTISLNLQDAVGQVDPGIANRMGSFGSVVFRFAGHSGANMFAASSFVGKVIRLISTSTAKTAARIPIPVA